MIDILTTRFHDAYTYLISEGGADNGNDNLIKERHIGGITRLNGDIKKYGMVVKSSESIVSIDDESCKSSLCLLI
jgi:hypothetical protein